MSVESMTKEQWFGVAFHMFRSASPRREGAVGYVKDVDLSNFLEKFQEYASKSEYSKGIRIQVIDLSVAGKTVKLREFCGMILGHEVKRSETTFDLTSRIIPSYLAERRLLLIRDPHLLHSEAFVWLFSGSWMSPRRGNNSFLLLESDWEKLLRKADSMWYLGRLHMFDLVGWYAETAADGVGEE